MHGAGAAHAAHHLVQDQQRAIAVADLADALEIAGQGGDAAGGGADDRFSEEGGDRVGADALKFGVEFVSQPVQILGVRLAWVLEAIGEARRDQTMGLGQDWLIMGAAHHVAAGGERAKGGAVIGLPPSDCADALRLTDLQEILARKLDGRLVALRAGGTEPGAGQAARLAVEDDFSKVFGRLVGEGAGMGIGHGGGLAPDCLGDPAVAVAQAGDRGPARSVDHFVAVFGV